MIKKAINNEKLPVYGNGLNVRDWIYVEDHCKIILELALKGSPGESYCIGMENELNNLEIVNMICDITGEKLGTYPERNIDFVKDRLGHDFRYAIDNSKIKDLIDMPVSDFKENLRSTFNYYFDTRFKNS